MTYIDDDSIGIDYATIIGKGGDAVFDIDESQCIDPPMVEIASYSAGEIAPLEPTPQCFQDQLELGLEGSPLFSSGIFQSSFPTITG